MDGKFDIIINNNIEEAITALNSKRENSYIKVLSTCFDNDNNICHTIYLKERDKTPVKQIVKTKTSHES